MARRQQQREDVVALLVRRLGPPQSNLFVEEIVKRGPRCDETSPGAAGAEVAAQDREAGDRRDPRGEAVNQRRRPVDPRLLRDTEDGAQDHREGDPLHVRAQRERLADRPALHLPPRRLRHQLGVDADAVAVEGRQQGLAGTQMGGVVEGEDRVRAERRLQHRRVRLTSVEDGRRAGEDLFRHLRVRDVEDLSEEGEPDAEDVAVAALAHDGEPERVARVAHGLHPGRRLRSWRLPHRQSRLATERS